MLAQSNMLYMLHIHISVAGHQNMMPMKESQSPSKPVTPLPKGPANEWTIKEVIQYITATDPALGVHASLFRKHVSTSSTSTKQWFIDYRCFLFQEIDGKALLLLTSDKMLKYMNLKLGPALKIEDLVKRLNMRRY